LLREFTEATGVYIGKLVPPEKEIGDNDDDKAHLDEDNPRVIRFTNVSKDHEFLIGKTLNPSQGITHEVFKVVEEG